MIESQSMLYKVLTFIIPAAEQSQTLHNTILDFAKTHNIELNIVQKDRQHIVQH